MSKQNTIVKGGASKSKKHPLSFYLIAILMPFILLIILEYVLRFSGVWRHYPLFVEVAEQNQSSSQESAVLQPNPDVIHRFFAKPEFAPAVAPDTFFFKKNKAQGQLRIVLMGGSTAAGFPYGRFGSPAGMLKQRLKALYPDQEIEVISVAMASINSYALLDFSDEVIDINPDIVLIYAGHNEYLGVMGVGSAYSAFSSYGANLLYLKLKDFAVYQAMQSLIYSFSNNVNSVDHSDSSRTVMAQVAREKNIALNSPLYEQGKAQFENNMNGILSKFSNANIPVFISTLASNEQDQAPFESDNSEAASALINPDKPRSMKRVIAQGTSLLSQGDGSADLAFKVAEAKVKQQEHDALRYFQLARDLDLLRFRAPTEFNAIIKGLVQADNVFLVDAEAGIRDDSNNRIIGKAHMLEHLHPNDRGYFLIAEAFLSSLIENGKLPSPSPYHKEQLNDRSAWQAQPLLTSDYILADHKIAVLMADYPFTDEKRKVNLPSASNKIEEIGLRRIAGLSWLEAQQRLLSLYQKQESWLEAATVAGLLYDSMLNSQVTAKVDLARAASQLYLKANNFSLSEYYARKALLALQQLPNSDRKGDYNARVASFTLTLAEALFKSGNTEASLNEVEQLLGQQPQHPRALAIKQLILQEAK